MMYICICLLTPDLSELALGEDCPVSPLPPREREPRPGRQQGRGEAGVAMRVTMGVWQPREAGTQEGEHRRPRRVQSSTPIGRQIHPEALIG